ncbi:MAG: 1-(5-phosphoribosyl)-5-[(5-phosphoribosylamino)methylideneamino]imidazole-4-carboxamide isomerase [Rhodospirillaceae bacterium]|nr:1-(5-phosphoribosyl)-5-[(5-phosphoribosylamino)methylideneamino]imidazole-4-carboxamide isomerase [Rhodospirillaceae bacterium]MDG1274349.1 1-(5-phosphoribosyl)-5-[(5-phosphoribosylamino)methylideneamino]imidazole-4-carboxamide isomerase [Alphaproteobacteria bacterium]
MILFPAIDLKNGSCVRLLRGNMNDATVFNLSPGEQAKNFAESGCRWLHVVDLDGAIAGRPINLEAVNSILDNVDVPVQLGGGIRNIKQVEFWLEKGISRIILGTVALRNPEFVIATCKAFPGKINVGIDALKGFVAVEGWANTSQITSLELAKRFEDAGVSALIFTDIDRDGALQGLNIDATVELSLVTSIPIIASGGVGSISDLRNLKERATKTISGVICGRALYNGAIDLKEGLDVLAA